MKKVFFSFAIATMMASLVACGGKTEQNAEGQDSTAVEAEAEVADPNRQDCGSFSAVVNEPFEIQSQSDDYLRFSVKGMWMSITGYPQQDMTAQDVFDETLNNGVEWAWQAQDDIVIGNTTWKVVNRLPYDELHDTAEWIFFADMPKGFCKVNATFGTGDMDDAVLEVLKSIKFT